MFLHVSIPGASCVQADIADLGPGDPSCPRRGRGEGWEGCGWRLAVNPREEEE